MFLFSDITVAQNEQILESINEDIYEKFEKASNEQDFELFASLHSEDMIRPNANRYMIMSANDYLAHAKKRYEYRKERDVKSVMELRVFERLYINEIASDRGVFKITSHPGHENEQSFYGQFHLLLRKEDGK